MSLWEVTVEVPLNVRADSRNAAERYALAVVMHALDKAADSDGTGTKVARARELVKRSDVAAEELDQLPFGDDDGTTIGNLLTE